MSLHLQDKLKKDTASAEKYLKFLMATYVTLSSGYTTFRIGFMLKQHSIDKYTFSALTSLGWVSKISTETGVRYFWRGPIPTLDNVDEVKKAISKCKNKTPIKITSPISASGKALIPIVKPKMSSKKKSTPSLQRYFDFLTELKLSTSNFSKIDVNGLVMVHQIAKGAFYSAVNLGIVLKEKSKNSKTVLFKWNSGEVTFELAQKVLSHASLQVKKSTLSKKQDNKEVNTEPIVSIPIVQTITGEVRLPIENKNLNKDFAMKLFKLGYVEEANQVLDTLISK